MYIYLSNYLTIELATDFSLYLDTNLQSPACIWIEEWRLKIPQKLFSSRSSILPICGGIDDPKKKILWNLQSEGKRLPSVYPFHSIPSLRPSIHPIHPPILSIHPSILSVHLHIYLPSYLFTYLSTYLSTNLSTIYLPIYLAIYLSIHPSNYTLQSLGCMWTEDSGKNNLQSKDGYRGYRQQRSIEKPPNRL